jgi:microcystin-dependent protein
MSRFKIGHTFQFGEQVTPKKLNDSVNNAEFGADAVDDTSIEVNIGKKLEVKAQGVTNDKLADASVSENKVQGLAITPEKLSESPPAVTTPKLTDSAVTTPKIADGAVTQSKLGSDVQLIPPGFMMPNAGANNNPSGWLLCDGSSYAVADFPDLYAAIGNDWGGNGTTFNVPDTRGVALRGLDDGRGLDPGRQFGTYQADEFKAHTHGYQVHKREGGKSGNYDPTNAEKLYETKTTTSTGGSETRMKNVAVRYMIKT